MKKICLIITVLLCTLSLHPQDIKLPSFYVQREIRAPQVVKDRLALVRKEIAAKKLQYVVGYTSVAERPIDKITGFRQPSQEEVKRIMEKIKPVITRQTGKDNNVVREVRVTGEMPWPGNPYIYGTPYQNRLDLRQAGFVTPVQDQGLWGSCWAFSAMAAYESSYKILTKKTIDTSEEFVVNCSGAGTWGGGWMFDVFIWMKDNQKNLADESSVPYRNPPTTCPPSAPLSNFYASDWGLVDPSKPINSIPSVYTIKDAICRYGAISTAMVVYPSFLLYVGGHYSPLNSESYNKDQAHAVAIIGWDDSIQCWLIKNSWGTNWGSECGYGPERGYMWIKYSACGIGCFATWVRASTIAHN